MSKKKIRVLMAMSGGVDSSVAAKLLKDQGYDVTGVFLHFWKEAGDVSENKCCSLESMLDAREVCRKIGIHLHTFDFQKPFKKAVVDNFLSEYKKGRTPNPCVECNKFVKLGLLLERAKALGFDYVATGHYLKIKKVPFNNKKEVKEKKSVKLKSKTLEKDNFIYKLYRAKDKSKDQTYFLYTFNQKQLSHLLFPLGNYLKPQVRELAKKFGFAVAEKKDSHEICFIPGKHHNDFLKRHLKLKPGIIVLKESGEVIAQHQGLPLYTIGQRRGIEIGGNGPYYVAEMDYKKNILYVIKNWNDKILYRQHLTVKNLTWLSGSFPKVPFSTSATIRYGHPTEKCVVTKIKVRSQECEVAFIKSQRAITVGQSIVFYKGEEVLGGGIIDSCF